MVGGVSGLSSGKMKNERKILLRDLNENIVCEICKGYLVDATTITECLHTFCKKCIVQYLEENTNCPKCDIELHQSHPLLYVAHDRTLQTIVYKLVANLERDELERQVRFYDARKLEYPAQLREKLEQFNINSSGGAGKSKPTKNHTTTTKSSHSNHQSNRNTISSNNNHHKEDGATTNKSSDANSHHTNNHTNDDKSSSNNTNEHNEFHKLDEPICIELEPLDGLQCLKEKYLLCSCHATITHLKKHVADRIFGDLELYKELDIVCDDEILGKDHTLKFIKVTKWKDKELPMRLNYRPKLVF